MKTLTILLLAFATAAGAGTFTAQAPSTTNNDDSCDIAVLPAATLLLPYFEVDINAPQTTARTTIFTITNTTQVPQIAHVTMWTDWGFPVLDFNIFLTGYDVQAINLYDVLGHRGVIAPPTGTSSETCEGARSLDNEYGNPLFSPDAASWCSVLPGVIPANILADLRTGLTTGMYSTCRAVRIGGSHANPTGYITIDVTANCSVTLPTEPEYADELLFENVLTGDYAWIDPNPTTGNYAGGNTLVHIRAVPEGGRGGERAATDLPATFYGRYMPSTAPTADRRQPLPSRFAARFIEGGTSAFNTNFVMWREGVSGADALCKVYADNAPGTVTEMVRFDEHENPTVLTSCPPLRCIPSTSTFPLTSSTPTSSSVFPPKVTVAGDIGGWMYLDLGARQNWMVVSMYAEGRYSAAFDPIVLSNGCTSRP